VSTIVVGVDGSAGAQAALRFAVEEARLRGATLRLVTAWHIPSMAYSGGLVVPFDRREFEQNAEAACEKALGAVREQTADLEVERVAGEGQPAHVLLQQAKDADLLVVGTRGHGGFAGLLLGSVSQQCAQHAPCPVVIVNEPERRAEPVEEIASESSPTRRSD
jgi:nucleotide-binding universal stress UspA family protein